MAETLDFSTLAHKHYRSEQVPRGARSAWRDIALGWPLLIASLTAIGILRLLALSLNATDLNVDEAQYWSWSRALEFGYFSKPPLIAWIIAAVTPLCGDGEACVRLPAVVLHLLTAGVIFLIGRRLVSSETGFWSAIAYATLPGVSLSSGIISTDVPLLLCWAIALLAFAEMVRVPTFAMAIVLGLALGFGINAKYAMLYFLPCAAIYLFMAPGNRQVLRHPSLWLAAAIAVLMTLPNLWWNLTHGFVTFAHTADNASWSGSLFHPARALEFFLTQFGVAGPIVFSAWLVIAARLAAAAHRRERVSDTDKLLLAFSVPIVTALVVQAFLSRSLANWAAPAYVAATLLVVNSLIRTRAWSTLRAALSLNAAIALLITFGAANAGGFVLPGGVDPYARTLGHRALVETVREGLLASVGSMGGHGAILNDDRDIAAAFAYYGRDLPIPVLSWRASDRPRHHFELVHPFTPRAPEPLLLVSRRADGSGIPEQFRSVLALGTLTVPAGDHSERTVHLYELSGYVGSQP